MLFYCKIVLFVVLLIVRFVIKRKRGCKNAELYD